MKLRIAFCFATLILMAMVPAGCGDVAPTASSDGTIHVTSAASPTSDSSLFLSQYVFPTSIDLTKRYMFYLHGRIIEDQGIPAVSPEYGNYEYEAILEKFASHGFTVISEQRPENADGMKYAEQVASQVSELLDAGVPPKNITIVGASKGGWITIAISNLLASKELNYVVMGVCDPDNLQLYKQQNISLYGNILTIRDSADGFAGSCEELFEFSEGKIARHEEIVLHVGTGHGILYKPLDEWILPTVQWTLSLTTTDESATLNSLEQVDDYPLYTMRYFGTYTRQANSNGQTALSKPTIVSAQTSCPVDWGCSLFATLGNEENRLFGRNFDWQFSPALLLFTDPPDGYASVSMVDIEYLGFGGDRSMNLTDLPLDERSALLDAPFLPFDGMNEKGLAIGMAAVPEEDMPYDPQKETIGELGVIREILDHAATVDEAIEILGNYNIDMEEVPIHYFIASALGDSAVVEFYRGEMVVFRNEASWQVATNFLLASTNGNNRGQCWRYDLISQRLEVLDGRVSSEDAIGLLEDVSQDNTQWSIVYHMTSSSLNIVMGQDYTGIVHAFQLEQSTR